MCKRENLIKYESLLQTIWKESLPLIGEPVLRFIFDASWKKISCSFDFFKNFRLNYNDTNFIKLDNIDIPKDIPKEEIERGLRALIFEILTFFYILWDDIIIKYLCSHIFKNKKEFYELTSYCNNW